MNDKKRQTELNRGSVDFGDTYPHSVNNTMFVLAIGNCFDGIRLVGLFDNPKDATNWAEMAGYTEWNIVPITQS